MQALLQAGVTNYLIIALDEEVRDYMQARGMNVYYHKVSGVHLFRVSCLASAGIQCLICICSVKHVDRIQP